MKVGGRGMNFNIRVTGPMEKSQLNLSRLSATYSDLSTFFNEYLGPEAYLEYRLNFETQGGFVGGWRALSPKYAEWKRKHFGAKPIMVLRELLKKSLTNRHDANAVFRADQKRMVLSTRLTYVNAHQHGINVPRRRVIFVPNNMIMRQLWKAWLRKGAVDAGLAVR